MVALYANAHENFVTNNSHLTALYQLFTDYLASDEIVSRNLGRSGLFNLLRKKKRQFKTEKVV
jgi:hypothetical protein